MTVPKTNPIMPIKLVTDTTIAAHIIHNLQTKCINQVHYRFVAAELVNNHSTLNQQVHILGPPLCPQVHPSAKSIRKYKPTLDTKTAPRP